MTSKTFSRENSEHFAFCFLHFAIDLWASAHRSSSSSSSSSDGRTAATRCCTRSASSAAWRWQSSSATTSTPSKRTTPARPLPTWRTSGRRVKSSDAFCGELLQQLRAEPGGTGGQKRRFFTPQILTRLQEDSITGRRILAVVARGGGRGPCWNGATSGTCGREQEVSFFCTAGLLNVCCGTHSTF